MYPQWTTFKLCLIDLFGSYSSDSSRFLYDLYLYARLVTPCFSGSSDVLGILQWAVVVCGWTASVLRRKKGSGKHGDHVVVQCRASILQFVGRGFLQIFQAWGSSIDSNLSTFKDIWCKTRIIMNNESWQRSQLFLIFNIHERATVRLHSSTFN